MITQKPKWGYFQDKIVLTRETKTSVEIVINKKTEITLHLRSRNKPLHLTAIYYIKVEPNINQLKLFQRIHK